MTPYRILIAPGAFKHSLSARAAADAIAEGLRESGLPCQLTLLPIADGGNGTLDAWLADGGTRHTLTVRDPLLRPIEADYGLLPDGQTAIIEMAQASGIELLADNERDAMRTTTYGTGQLMQAALEAGARRFIIGLGGSATVDGGSGALRALGVRLLATNGADIPHGGGGLSHLATVDTSGLDPRWHDCEIIIATDVENPTLGDAGAAAVFGPQKGASPEQVAILERGLTAFFGLIERKTGRALRDLRGGGAAGALSAGLMAFVGGRIEPGIDLLLAHNRFVERLANADLVITGEGQIDEQTIYGKGPIGVARLARDHGVPTVALVGGLHVDEARLHDDGVRAVLPVVDGPMLLSDALADAPRLVRHAARRLGYLLALRPQSPQN